MVAERIFFAVFFGMGIIVSAEEGNGTVCTLGVLGFILNLIMCLVRC